MFEPDNLEAYKSVQYETLPILRVAWEHFEEPANAPPTSVLYSYSIYVWIAVSVLLIAFWAVWLLLIYGYIHHYSGQFAPLTNPLHICWLGFMCIWSSVQCAPQRLVFTNGSPECTHIIGFGPLTIRRVIALEKVRGLLLISKTQNGAPYPALYVKWVSIGVTMFVARYTENEVAIERAEYISARTGLPIIDVKLRPVIRLRPGKKWLEL